MAIRTDVAALRALTEVAATGSLAGAARNLDVSQQGISSRMRALEADLGVTLFIRSAQGTTLTEIGTLVAGWAAEVLVAAHRFESSVASLAQTSVKPVRAAASLTIAEHLLPRALSEYRKTGGEAIELQAANSATVIDRVRDGSADIGFIETPHLPTDLATSPLGVDELVVVVRPGHRWTRRKTITPTELTATPLLVREHGSGTREALDDALRSLTDTPAAAPAAVLPTTAVIRSTAISGDDPAVLSNLAVADDIKSGRLIRVAVRDTRLTRPLTIIWRPNNPPSDSARDLFPLIAASAASTRTAQAPTARGERRAGT